MFLMYLQKFSNKNFKKIKFIVDIDKRKQNKFLQTVNKLIISPKKLLKIIKRNDTILISNSNYTKEIKSFFKKSELINFITI